jgi:hypothetical protein
MKDIEGFYNEASTCNKSIPKELGKRWSAINKMFKDLNNHNSTTNKTKDSAEASVEKIRTTLMLLQNDLVNGKGSSNYTKNQINKLIKSCNDQLDNYVKQVSNLFDQMSNLRHSLLGFGQAVVRSLSQTRSIDALAILQRRFCESPMVTSYRKTFQLVKDSFKNIENTFKKDSENDPYPPSFVNFISKLLEFQTVKFDELQGSIIEYQEAAGMADSRFKAAVSLSMSLIDFDYLYTLSQHLIRLHSSIKMSKDAENNADSDENSGASDSGDADE